ncbi:MAG: CBS domain-containing protein [Betaproteobacteria bacterium]|nr:CBS domain-containing protein [Betaproteobacteria bacterium]
MKAKDVMTKSVVSVDPDTDVRKIARLLLQRHISAVPVVDGRGRVIGMVSEGDLMRRPESRTEGHPSWWLDLLDGPEEHALMYLKSHGTTARDVMTRKVITVGENTSLEDIATLLERNRIKRVPVLSGGKLVGIVSRANLLHGLVAARGKPVRRAAPDSRRVRDAVMAELRKAGVQTLYMNVVIADGTAQLWGYAESAAERRAVALAARRTPGVKKVENHLAVLTPQLIGSLGAQ